MVLLRWKQTKVKMLFHKILGLTTLRLECTDLRNSIQNTPTTTTSTRMRKIWIRTKECKKRDNNITTRREENIYTIEIQETSAKYIKIIQYTTRTRKIHQRNKKKTTCKRRKSISTRRYKKKLN